MKKYFVLVISILILVGIYACKSDDNATVSNDVKDNPQVSTGDELIDDNNASIDDMALYDDTPENQSKGINRSFENAPPLIPHSVKGMTDIKIGDNECLLCHMPEKSKLENATPMPKSHFTDYRPTISKKGKQWLVDAKEGDVTQKDQGQKLVGSRFFCNQCHVPQTDAKLIVKNVFKAKFRNTGDKQSSNLDKNIGEGVE